MDDGVRLAATLYLPGHEEPAPCFPAPCLLEALPYRKDDVTFGYADAYRRLCDGYGRAGAGRRTARTGTGRRTGPAAATRPATAPRRPGLPRLRVPGGCAGPRRPRRTRFGAGSAHPSDPVARAGPGAGTPAARTGGGSPVRCAPNPTCRSVAASTGLMRSPRSARRIQGLTPYPRYDSRITWIRRQTLTLGCSCDHLLGQPDVRSRGTRR
jgi:hypothetical protein